MPYLSQASRNSRTTSPLPFFHGELATECLVVLVGQRQKPSWCLAVIIAILKPPSFSERTHCSQSSSVGLKTAGSSFPLPHSLPVNVLMPKCRKAVNSICCHANCCGVGTRREAISTFCSKVAPTGKVTWFS